MRCFALSASLSAAAALVLGSCGAEPSLEGRLCSDGVITSTHHATWMKADQELAKAGPDVQKRVLPHLISCAGETKRSQFSRDNVMMSIGGLGSLPEADAAVEPLARILAGDENPFVRKSAAIALMLLGERGRELAPAFPALLGAMKDADAETARIAGSNLGWLGARALSGEGELAAMIDREASKPFARRHLKGLLDSWGRMTGAGEAGTDALAKRLGDPVPRARWLAARELRTRKSAAVEPLLRGLDRDDDPVLSDLCSDSLSELKADGRPAVRPLLSRMTAGRKESCGRYTGVLYSLPLEASDLPDMLRAARACEGHARSSLLRMIAGMRERADPFVPELEGFASDLEKKGDAPGAAEVRETIELIRKREIFLMPL